MGTTVDNRGSLWLEVLSDNVKTYLRTVVLTLQLSQPAMALGKRAPEATEIPKAEEVSVLRRLPGVWELFTEAEGHLWVGQGHGGWALTLL